MQGASTPKRGSRRAPKRPAAVAEPWITTALPAVDSEPATWAAHPGGDWFTLASGPISAALRVLAPKPAITVIDLTTAPETKKIKIDAIGSAAVVGGPPPPSISFRDPVAYCDTGVDEQPVPVRMRAMVPITLTIRDPAAPVALELPLGYVVADQDTPTPRHWVMADPRIIRPLADLLAAINPLLDAGMTKAEDRGRYLANLYDRLNGDTLRRVFGYLEWRHLRVLAGTCRFWRHKVATECRRLEYCSPVLGSLKRTGAPPNPGPLSVIGLNFRALRQLTIRGCQTMNELFFTHLAEVCSTLESLALLDCRFNNVVTRADSKCVQPHAQRHLRTLVVWNETREVHNISRLCPAIIGLANLRRMVFVHATSHPLLNDAPLWKRVLDSVPPCIEELVLDLRSCPKYFNTEGLPGARFLRLSSLPRLRRLCLVVMPMEDVVGSSSSIPHSENTLLLSYACTGGFGSVRRTIDLPHLILPSSIRCVDILVCYATKQDHADGVTLGLDERPRAFSDQPTVPRGSGLADQVTEWIPKHGKHSIAPWMASMGHHGLTECGESPEHCRMLRPFAEKEESASGPWMVVADVRMTTNSQGQQRVHNFQPRACPWAGEPSVRRKRLFGVKLRRCAYRSRVWQTWALLRVATRTADAAYPPTIVADVPEILGGEFSVEAGGGGGGK